MACWRTCAVALSALLLACARSYGYAQARVCAYGSWSEPATVRDQPPDLRYPSVAVGIGDVLVIGLAGLGASANSAAGTAPPAVRAPGLRLVRLGDRSPVPVLREFTFAYPRAAVDRRGVLHVLWAEPDSGQRPSTAFGDEFRRLRLTSLWHVTYRHGEWGRPERIYRSGEIRWSPVAISALVADSARGMHLVFTGDSPTGMWTLTHLALIDGRWRATELRTSTPAVYAGLAVGHGRQLAIAYVAAAHDTLGSRSNSVFVARSADAGATWDAPVEVSLPAERPAYEPRVLIDSADTLHVLWTQFGGELGGSAVWHVVSTGSGRAWGGRAALRLASAPARRRARRRGAPPRPWRPGATPRSRARARAPGARPSGSRPSG
jgi:hypothetical protein